MQTKLDTTCDSDIIADTRWTAALGFALSLAIVSLALLSVARLVAMSAVRVVAITALGRALIDGANAVNAAITQGFWTIKFVAFGNVMHRDGYLPGLVIPGVFVARKPDETRRGTLMSWRAVLYRLLHGISAIPASFILFGSARLNVMHQRQHETAMKRGFFTWVSG